jgi:histidinol phosphatase-like PHP family hydrolase
MAAGWPTAVARAAGRDRERREPGGMLTNGALAELLRRSAADESAGHRRRALDRAGRAALFWPEEAAALVSAGEDLTTLRAVGPWIASSLHRWIEEDADPPEPPEERRDFLTLARARRVLAEHPAWTASLRADLQMHTTWSDGAESVRQMADAADRIGYGFIAITDHSKSLRIASGMDERELARAGEEIAATNEELRQRGSGLRVLRSIEMDVFVDGSGDMDPTALRHLDLVLGAFHTNLRDPSDQTDRYVAALRNPDVHVLAHPRARKYGRRVGLVADWPRVVREAAALDKALEIDASPDRQDLNVELLRIAAEAGVRISIGTDAHQPAELAFMEFGLAAALEANVPRDRIVNFGEVDDLLAWTDSLRARTVPAG